MKKTKFVAVAAAAVMAATAAGALAGCGSSANTINILLLANPHEGEFYNSYFEYMEDILHEDGLDYSIKFTRVASEDYYERLNSVINGSNIPDIFYIRPNEIYQFKNKIASLQSYADEHGHLSQNSDGVELDDIYEEALDMYRYDPETGALGEGELYAFPKDLSTQQLGYNKTLLEQYTKEITALTNSKGNKMKMPWEMDFDTENYSWEDYKQICATIKTASGGDVYPCDVPPIEVIVKSFGGDLIDLSQGKANGAVASIDENSILRKAIKYQAELVDAGAYHKEGYKNFTGKHLCFYGLVGSWEISDYNDEKYIGEGNWDVMPWPTEDGDTDWQGIITSAGYVVSQKCANSAKGDVAKRIAMSFMGAYAQEQLVKSEQISLPLRKSVLEDFLSPENDDLYAPKSRSIFMDVVSGEHGFRPAEYYTYNSSWLDALDTELTLIYTNGAAKSGDGVKTFNSIKWNEIHDTMQRQYDNYKNL